MENNAENGAKGWKALFSKKVILAGLGLAVIIGVGVGAYLVKASENPEFCSSCHLMVPYYDSYHDSNLLANQHAEAELDCHDCHESSIAIQAQEGWKFITGNYQIPLERREFSKEFCLECHDDFDTTVKAATDFEHANPHDSHNGELECNVCHNMHKPSQVFCAECHIFDWFGEIDESWAN